MKQQAATTYTCKCSLMQGDWIKWNSMTERWEFLYVKVSKKETFQRSWKSIKEWAVHKACHTHV